MDRVKPADNPLINRRIEVMGMFYVPMTVTNLQSGVNTTVDALVDTGAHYPVVPVALLQQLGIEPTSSEMFSFADGRRDTLKMGEARFTVQGKSTPSLCIFGPAGSEPILGVLVLEGLGLTVDPVNQRLLPAELLLL